VSHRLRYALARWLFKLVCWVTPYGSGTFVLTASSTGEDFICAGLGTVDSCVDRK